MRDYVLVTDDSCDLPLEYYQENEIAIKHLGFTIDGQPYTRREMPPAAFFAQMKAGKMPATTQVSVDQWAQFFESFLAAGQDVLYWAFSSGLSGTCGSAQVAARELLEKYPQRKVVVVDSLCASLGQGLMLRLAIQRRDDGASLEELAQWLEDTKLKMSHMVAVDDLMHLHRGGRVSKTSAVAGSLMGIKPIIHMNNEGKLVPIDKVRGRRQSLHAVVDKTEKLVGDTPNDQFMVCHSDCLDDAQYIADLAVKRFGIKEYQIHDIGPVIGAHTGRGTVSLFMLANHR